MKLLLFSPVIILSLIAVHAFYYIDAQRPRDLFNLETSYEDLVKTDVDVELEDGTVLTRYEHRINGVPIINSGAMIVTKGTKMRAGRGRGGPRQGVVRRLNKGVGRRWSRKQRRYGFAAAAAELPVAQAAILVNGTQEDEQEALGTCYKSITGSTDPTGLIANLEVAVKNIIFDSEKQDDAFPAYFIKVSGVLVAASKHISENCIINGADNKVVYRWSNIMSAIPSGLDGVTGKLFYGSGNLPNLPLTPIPGTNKCRCRTPDGSVRCYMGVPDFDGRLDKNAEPAEFDCTNGPNDQVNGAFSALADTYYNTIKSLEMFRHPQYGAIKRVDQVATLGYVRAIAHHGTNVPNAVSVFDDGLYFGDGDANHFPYGTQLDVVGHEMGHAVIAAGPKLVYSHGLESACLHEGFADISGELAKFYMDGTNDFKNGNGVTKPGVPPAPRDMRTAVDYNNYFPNCPDGDPDNTRNCREAHSCAAISNHIFYKLATSPGWNTRLAGRAFVFAARLLFKSDETIAKAGCHVASIVREANINNGDVKAVTDAWKAAGIDLNNEANCLGATLPTLTPTRKYFISKLNQPMQLVEILCQQEDGHLAEFDLYAIQHIDTIRALMTTKGVTELWQGCYFMAGQWSCYPKGSAMDVNKAQRMSWRTGQPASATNGQCIVYQLGDQTPVLGNQVVDGLATAPCFQWKYALCVKN